MNERVRQIDKGKYGNYLQKATEFYHTMKKAEEDEEWNAVALNAIHCAISSFDALTVFYLGVRSSGQRHEDVTQVIKKTNLESVDEKIKQFTEVIRLKTMVEYDVEQPSENEARRIALQTERIHAWAKKHLKA